MSEGSSAIQIKKAIGNVYKPDYESEYGAMTDAEIKEEKKILKELNKQIFVERLKYKYNQWREKRLYGKEAPDAISINTE